MPRYRHGGTQPPLSAAAHCPSEEAASDEDEDGQEAADEGDGGRTARAVGDAVFGASLFDGSRPVRPR
ncbi:hypothetical protein DIPPA_21328 [Diplonema papillatum]|nr:hypothetical protein DIPPA_21328 [Diplonema papillatum]